MRNRFQKKSSLRKEPAVILELMVESLTHDGRGLARHQGKAVFVDGGLPGECVKAKVTKSSKRFDEARTLEVVQVSPQRIEPSCPLFSRCGGCSLQYMPVDLQLKAKQDAVLSQLQRWSKVVPQELAVPITEDEYAYRRRVRFSVKYNRLGEFQLGFREAGHHRLVDVDSCIILNPALQRVLPLIRQWLSTVEPGIVSHIECLASDDAIGLVVRHVRHLDAPLRKQLKACFNSVPQAVYCWFQGGKGEAKAQELEDEQCERVDPRMSYALPSNLRLYFHPQDFIQSNHGVNLKMVNQAVAWMAPSKQGYYVDLFCGIGNFSLALAQYAGRVCGMEGAYLMVQRATENAKANQLDNTHFINQDLTSSETLSSQVLSDAQKQGYCGVAGVLLDPPRAGAQEICQKIGELAPERIVYVSCDSSTFARDAGILVDQGYSLLRLGVMDMFPQTAHVEVMGLFEINSKK